MAAPTKPVFSVFDGSIQFKVHMWFQSLYRIRFDQIICVCEMACKLFVFCVILSVLAVNIAVAETHSTFILSIHSFV